MPPIDSSDDEDDEVVRKNQKKKDLKGSSSSLVNRLTSECEANRNRKLNRVDSDDNLNDLLKDDDDEDGELFAGFIAPKLNCSENEKVDGSSHSTIPHKTKISTSNPTQRANSTSLHQQQQTDTSNRQWASNLKSTHLKRVLQIPHQGKAFS